jgi:cation transport regulator ChaB
MPYESINELPKSVRNLPSRAKALYMKAFNSTWEEYGDLEDEVARDRASHESAWSTVKEQYVKDEDTGEWVKIDKQTGRRSRHSLRHRRSKSSGPAQPKAQA